MGRPEKLEVVMRRAVGINDSKDGGRLTNDVTLKSYKRHIHDFADWASTFGIKRVGDIQKQGYTPATLIQKYTDELVKKSLKATTVHTYLAPVCKGLGVGMEQIRKPPRLAADICKNTKLRQNKTGERQSEDPRYERILRLAQIVVVRSRALARLTANHIKVDENADHIVAIRDKGGKESIQLLLPHEVELVRSILSTDAGGNALKPGARPFTTGDLGKIAFSKYRIERAQAIEAYFDRRFHAWESMPSKTEAQRQARAEACTEAKKERQMWIDKIVAKYAAGHPEASAKQVERYRRDLSRESLISIREGNRERAIALGRPTEYDRVSVRIASVYVLSHWVDETTIRNYLTK